MLVPSLSNAASQFFALAPSGRQLEEIAKAAKKAVPYVDDAARVVVQNKSFLASIPVWVWVVLAIVVVGGVIYYFVEEN